MPLARTAMHQSGEQIHIAVWPTVNEMAQLASRHYAFEGRCFVLAVGLMMPTTDLPAELPHDVKHEWVERGGSAIICTERRLSGRANLRSRRAHHRRPRPHHDRSREHGTRRNRPLCPPGYLHLLASHRGSESSRLSQSLRRPHAAPAPFKRLSSVPLKIKIFTSITALPPAGNGFAGSTCWHVSSGLLHTFPVVFVKLAATHLRSVETVATIGSSTDPRLVVIRNPVRTLLNTLCRHRPRIRSHIPRRKPLIQRHRQPLRSLRSQQIESLLVMHIRPLKPHIVQRRNHPRIRNRKRHLVIDVRSVAAAHSGTTRHPLPASHARAYAHRCFRSLSYSSDWPHSPPRWTFSALTGLIQIQMLSLGASSPA